MALCTAGFALAWVVGDLEDGAALIDRALLLNPSLSWAWYFSGWVKAWLGEPEAAIERHAHAIRLSPRDIHIFAMQAGIAGAHFFAGRAAEALEWAKTSLRAKPDLVLSNCVAAASAAFAGQDGEARTIMERLRQLDPGLRVSNLGEHYPIRREQDFQRLADGLRKAGLPE